MSRGSIPSRRQRCRSPRAGQARLRAEHLEDRAAPAVGDLFLSEVHFEPLFGDNNQDQYLEFRGAPGATVAPGTYLVVVDGDASGNTPGVINSVFDLSGLQLGTNGFLVLLQAGAKYPVSAGASELRGTDGFSGLPGNIFQDNSTLSNRFEFLFGSNTFLLIESPTPPAPDDDVDGNNDGVLDGPAGNWAVLDSVSVLAGGAGDVGYGQIVFATGGAGRAPAGATFVPTDALSYVARAGESTGHAKTDWVAGRTTEQTGGAFDFRLTHGIFGNPSPRVFAGRVLDHLGTSNFLTSVEGVKFEDTNANAARDSGEPGLPGFTVYLDRNGNGVFDSFESVAEPDNFPDNTELTNRFPGVTLTVAGLDNEPLAFAVRSVTDADRPSTGTKVFAHEGGAFWDTNNRLRMDFYKPVQSLSIDFINSSTLADVIGRLDLYNADGNLLDTVLTVPFRDGVQTLTATRAAPEIAYALAYSDPSQSPFGDLDNLRFTRPEDSAVTGPDGAYVIGGLQNGPYTVAEVPHPEFTQTFPAGGTHAVTIVLTVPVRGIDFGNRPGGLGSPPGTPGLPPGVPPIPPGSHVTGVFAAGAAPGADPLVRVFSADGQPAFTLTAFEPSANRGGVRVAVADVTGDGVPDVIAGTGPGSRTAVHVFDGRTTELIEAVPAFEAAFTGGVFVAAGDVNGDGFADVIITPDQGGGPRVRVVSGRDFTTIADFFGIEDPNFRGGARAAVGDLNGDGRVDLLVAAGFGGGPRIAAFDGVSVATGSTTPAKLFGDIFVFEDTLRNGVFITSGDLDGDGSDDLIAGGGPGGGPRVFALSGRELV
ncbi:MAG TPA: VCBS repeat-containing protein, partial [Gemmataceae bacterium]